MIEEYGDGNHEIFRGDSLKVLGSKIEDSSIDLIFVDPPYNIGKNFNQTKDKWEKEKHYLKWSYKWIDLCIKKLKENGSIYLMTATQFMPYFDIYIRKKLNILSRIVWSYDSSGVQAKNFYGSMHEPILFCVKNKSDYTFNSKEIEVEARTGSQRKLIDYRKNPPQPFTIQKSSWKCNV